MTKTAKATTRTPKATKPSKTRGAAQPAAETAPVAPLAAPIAALAPATAPHAAPAPAPAPAPAAAAPATPAAPPSGKAPRRATGEGKAVRAGTSLAALVHGMIAGDKTMEGLAQAASIPVENAKHRVRHVLRVNHGIEHTIDGDGHVRAVLPAGFTEETIMQARAAEGS